MHVRTLHFSRCRPSPAELSAGTGSPASTMIASLQKTLIDLISTPLSATGFSVLVLVGFVTVASNIWSLLRFINIYFLRPGKNLRRLGDWAAVTGATDGIGKAYAEALAKRGAGPTPDHPCGPRITPWSSQSSSCEQSWGIVTSDSTHCS